jgi:fatty-acyl-CoA synthase
VGAILVNLNPAYRSLELEYALTQSQVSLLVCARGLRQADYVTMVRMAIAELGLEQEVHIKTA